MKFEPAETIDAETAVSRLLPGDRVHTRLVDCNQGSTLIGASWPREKLEALFRECGRVSLSGPNARSHGYGLAVEFDPGVFLFVRSLDVSELVLVRGFN